MSKVIDAIFENGVFRPLTKVKLPQHRRLTIILPDEIQKVGSKKCSLTGIIDIATGCIDSDLSVHHDKYLYGETDN